METLSRSTSMTAAASCVFDFKAVFKGGASAEKRGVNVCQISTFTFTP